MYTSINFTAIKCSECGETIKIHPNKPFAGIECKCTKAKAVKPKEEAKPKAKTKTKAN